MISVRIISTVIVWLVMITVGVAITEHRRLHMRRLTVIRIRAKLVMTVMRRSSRAVGHALMIMLMGLLLRLLLSCRRCRVVEAIWRARRNWLLEARVKLAIGINFKSQSNSLHWLPIALRLFPASVVDSFWVLAAEQA